MNILQVIPYFVPSWDYGGPVQVAYRLSRQMVKRGHEVTIFTTDARNASSRTEKRSETIDGIRVVRFANLSNVLAYRSKIFLSPGMLPAIRDELRRFDIVHLHELRTIQNVIAHHYARKYGIPYILQAHGSLPRVAAKQRLKQWFDDIWGYRLLRDAARVLALTTIEAEQYQAMRVSADKIEILPNGIDLPEFENLPERGEFKKKYGLQDGERIVLYLGRIHQTKGIDLLIRAFAALSPEIDNARLALVGPDAGYSSALAAMARQEGIGNKVMFTGPLYQKDRLAAYIDASVFVTPTYDGFPVTFLEALACGIPIVTTENGGGLDWISQTGLVASHDEAKLKDAIVSILENPELAQRFSKNGKKLVRERFAWSKIAESLEQVYLTATGRGRP